MLNKMLNNHIWKLVKDDLVARKSGLSIYPGNGQPSPNLAALRLTTSVCERSHRQILAVSNTPSQGTKFANIFNGPETPKNRPTNKIAKSYENRSSTRKESFQGFLLISYPFSIYPFCCALEDPNGKG